MANNLLFLNKVNRLPYKVFISHTGEDTWVARQIELHLNEAGADTFLRRGKY